MGLFDKFRSRVKEVAQEVDEGALTAEANSPEGLAAIEQATIPSEMDWEDEENPTSPLSEDERTQLESSPPPEDDEWEEWDDEESPAPQMMTKKERKFLERQEKEVRRQQKLNEKEMKRRGGVQVERPKGSRVDLSMMRTTTGRQLVEVNQAPKGSSKSASVTTGGGTSIEIELGGGVVEGGGRIIKPGEALDQLLEELEWVLLESDISQEATHALLDGLRRGLVGAQLRKGAELTKVVEAALKRGLTSLLQAGYWDFNASVRQFIQQGDTPVTIMLVGVNGTGKTTTAAKIAKRLLDQNLSVIAAAGDTFRAGAIQQLEAHCQNLGIRCISSQRGGDSAAIARDAIESAKARNIDVVLIDTAGRMQNKTNLMNELNKVRRVTNPHLTLFVGDSLAGNDAVEQAKMFQEIMQFDGAILTKMDTDAKGGAGLSIAFATGKPIVFAGVGQGYDDLLQFEPNWLLDQLFE